MNRLSEDKIHLGTALTQSQPIVRREEMSLFTTHGGEKEMALFKKGSLGIHFCHLLFIFFVITVVTRKQRYIVVLSISHTKEAI